MMISVIGGLLISNLLTLFVVPCSYRLIGSKHVKVVALGEGER
jgi:multidrug efflux pump subunit AcrB